MAIEIEYKYVIKKDDNFADNLIKNTLGSFCKIKQIYLSAGARFRSLEYGDGRIKYEFTYKEKIDVGHLEINSMVTKDDFDIALGVSVGGLKKDRFVLYTKNHKWEIDFFKDYNTEEVYFILMECEVENKSVIPNLDELPAFIKEAIIKKVTLDDSAFSSYKLGNPEYAINLLKTL